ncbi:MAG: hypothetical protein NWF05_00765 [Candidatus Bathyarchaeota archaeon]|nr:hypothetical protein [Candidatus Bathyarchaeota archaeon]
MTDDFCRVLVESFLRSSWVSVKVLVNAAKAFNPQNRKPVSFFKFKGDQRTTETWGGEHFFLRGSVEYTNPQLTVEEVQGIIGTRLLEVCGNYFLENGLREPEAGDVAELCELLKKPPRGKIAGFLLNTDDVEADRYSMNPLKTSLVESGQSAYPAANVTTHGLAVDSKFAQKYEDTLICRGEIELITDLLDASKGSYLDFVDSVKYTQLTVYSEFFGMDLFLPSLRMPLTTLQLENADGLLHHLISGVHRDYESVGQAYECMGRSMNKRTTLLTVPHSAKGYGSKRAARGRIYFDGERLESVRVKYKDTLLYPNAIDPKDVSVAKCRDDFNVEAPKLSSYMYVETPSSPQFFLYALGSPEDAALWHGVGAFGSPKLLQSYTRVRSVCKNGRFLGDLSKYDARVDVPLHLNLAPSGVWFHPVHRNIDASIGCVKNLGDLARLGMKVEHLTGFH